MPPAVNWPGQIIAAKSQLDAARAEGDWLKIDLAEAGLNNILDRYRDTLVTDVTGKEEE